MDSYHWLNQAAYMRFRAFKKLLGSHEKGAHGLSEPKVNSGEEEKLKINMGR